MPFLFKMKSYAVLDAASDSLGKWRWPWPSDLPTSTSRVRDWWQPGLYSAGKGPRPPACWAGTSVPSTGLFETSSISSHHFRKMSQQHQRSPGYPPVKHASMARCHITHSSINVCDVHTDYTQLPFHNGKHKKIRLAVYRWIFYTFKYNCSLVRWNQTSHLP